MENQHRKITGYRELDQKEIDLMNKVKALGPEIESVLLEVQNHIAEQNTACGLLSDTAECVKESQRITNATAWRWSEEGKTNLQIGLMLLTRAVAQPEFF